MVDVGDARSESKLRNSCSEYLTAEVQKVLACCVARLKKNAATTFHYKWPALISRVASFLFSFLIIYIKKTQLARGMLSLSINVRI